jgi:hypothetical protein
MFLSIDSLIYICIESTHFFGTRLEGDCDHIVQLLNRPRGQGLGPRELRGPHPGMMLEKLSICTEFPSILQGDPPAFHVIRERVKLLFPTVQHLELEGEGL